MFRIVFWNVLPFKIIVDNYFTRQYVPEDNSVHHTRRLENLKSHRIYTLLLSDMTAVRKDGDMSTNNL
jgi:hypothetical protein